MSEGSPLAGGLGNAGAVVRVGDTVRRPTGPWTPAVHALLEHFANVGFTGAPRVRGVDEQGREILDFVTGEVAVPPFPAWSNDDDLLDSVAALQRGAHAAARDFVPPSSAEWGGLVPPVEFDGRVMCHNDLCRENVVVRDGVAVAMIDFDWARPVDPLWDVVVAARHWVPIMDPDDGDADDGRGGLDQVARAQRFWDAHELDAAERRRAVDGFLAMLDAGLVHVKRWADEGHAGHRAQWDGGYPQRNRRAHAWVQSNLIALS